MVRISGRFCGPPESGNGGYSAGLLAAELSSETPVEVTLRRPPPLDADLQVIAVDDSLHLCHGDLLVAEARSVELELELPPAVPFAVATRLSEQYIGHTRHSFPTCFVCGPARRAGDGLRIFPGAEQAGDIVSAPWLPHASLANEQGFMQDAVMWAALDCAGYFGCAAPDYPVALLGRMTAAISGHVRPAEPCVVRGWSLGREGRKLHAGTAVFDSGGQCVARARQTWILPNPDSSPPSRGASPWSRRRGPSS